MQLRSRLTTIIFVAVAALSVVGTASAQNVLVNGDFEFGDLTGWEVFGSATSAGVTVESPDNGPSQPGTNHAFMDNQQDGLGLTLKQTTLPATAGPGEVFYSFDLKLGEAELGGVFFVEIFAEQSGVGIVGGSGLLGNYTPADWTNFSGSFVAPAGTDFLSIQFSANTGANVGSVSSMRVDNVSLSQNVVPVETSNLGELKSLYR